MVLHEVHRVRRVRGPKSPRGYGTVRSLLTKTSPFRLQPLRATVPPWPLFRRTILGQKKGGFFGKLLCGSYNGIIITLRYTNTQNLLMTFFF
ncbi:hypothetical protein TNCT_367101 [Trichonephila clavata]|uniref:Uncharacterized protein n=1 Tax=Trichonephila clavata TaxID=2740835 RepID=A0A8X6I7F8_TRICU|nr:hypothetical protein TNCT_367101 [Trichonephila clavata]